MLGNGSVQGYDQSLTMFSPEGRILQVEYAMEAVSRGLLAIGLMSKAGVVITTIRKYSSIMDPENISKIFKIDDHIGCAISGLHADSRVLVDYARVQCQIYRLTYDEPSTVQMITRRLADIKQQYTQVGGVRPFGSSLIIIGVDPKTNLPRLATTAPPGTYQNWKGTTIGRGQKAAAEDLEKELKDDMSLDEITKLGVDILKKHSDEDIDSSMLSIARVSVEDGVFKILSEEEAKTFL